MAFSILLPHAKSSKGLHARVSVSAVSELIVKAPGKARHDTRLGLSAPGFSTGGPVNLTTTIANHGNVYALENGLRATNSGKAVVAFNGALVLAGATRTLSEQWPSPPAFCLPCHVHLAGTNASATM